MCACFENKYGWKIGHLYNIDICVKFITMRVCVFWKKKYGLKFRHICACVRVRKNKYLTQCSRNHRRWRSTRLGLWRNSLNYFRSKIPGNDLKCPRYLWCSQHFDIVSHGTPLNGFNRVGNAEKTYETAYIWAKKWILWFYLIDPWRHEERHRAHHMWDHMFCRTFFLNLAPDCKPAPILAEHTIWEIQRNGPYSDWHRRFWTRDQGNE